MVRFSVGVATLGIVATLFFTPASALASDPVTVNDPAAAATFSDLQSRLAGTSLLGVKAKYTSTDPDGTNFSMQGTLNGRSRYFYGTMRIGTSQVTLYATSGRTIARVPYKNCWKKASSKLSVSNLAMLILAPFDVDSWTGPGSPGPALFGNTGPGSLHWTVSGTTQTNADVVYDAPAQRVLSTTVTQNIPAIGSAEAEDFGAAVSLKYKGVSTRRPKHTRLCR